MEMQGNLNVTRFYETLTAILAKKHNVEIVVKVHKKPKKEETA